MWPRSTADLGGLPMIDRRRFLLGCSITVGALSGCAGPSDTGPTSTTPSTDSTDTPLQLTTSAFEGGEPIPEEFSCVGADRSPPLSIGNVPEGTASIALVVDDPDAPDGPFTHWLLWDVPPDVSSIPAAVPTTPTVESLGGATQGENDFGDVGYRGPCPPSGSTHTYRFTLYALDSPLGVSAGANREIVQSAIAERRIASDRLTGTFER